MRLSRAAAVLIVLGLVLAGCAPALPGVPTVWTTIRAAPPCRLDDGVLTLSGPTNARMQACVEALGAFQAQVVRLDSPGGDVDHAMRIAERLKPLGAEMVVVGGCHSSCGNYLLPMARRIRMEPGSLIALHGSIDAMFVEKHPWATAMAQRQAVFARIHAIPYGWLMYRTADEGRRNSLGAYLQGERETWRGEFGEASPGFVAVEDTMLRSCLPGIEIVPLQDTFLQRAATDARLRRRMVEDRTYSSGSLSCVPQGPVMEPAPD